MPFTNGDTIMRHAIASARIKFNSTGKGITSNASENCGGKGMMWISYTPSVQNRYVKKYCRSNSKDCHIIHNEGDMNAKLVINMRGSIDSHPWGHPTKTPPPAAADGCYKPLNASYGQFIRYLDKQLEERRDISMIHGSKIGSFIINGKTKIIDRKF